VLLVAWALGVAIAGAGIGGITPMVRSSAVLARVDTTLPTAADGLLGAFNDVVGTSFFPRYLEPFAPERIVRVAPGPQRILTDPDVEDAAPSVLKIRGTNECGRGVEGSGFVYAEDRLMTNAHVVAGVADPEVEVGGSTVGAEVVYYNADLDVAVLDLETGTLSPLDFDATAQAEDGVAILGYPQDGPYDVQTGRIRAEQRLRSPDIYGDGTVIREVFSLRGLVRPGNSGGPIVSSAGDVVGVVFAASVTDRDTGYALTAEQVSRSAELGISNTQEVSTGDCAG
jgi:S1-C subfamily serine protease